MSNPVFGYQGMNNIAGTKLIKKYYNPTKNTIISKIKYTTGDKSTVFILQIYLQVLISMLREC